MTYIVSMRVFIRLPPCVMAMNFNRFPRTKKKAEQSAFLVFHVLVKHRAAARCLGNYAALSTPLTNQSITARSASFIVSPSLTFSVPAWS